VAVVLKCESSFVFLKQKKERGNTMAHYVVQVYWNEHQHTAERFENVSDSLMSSVLSNIDLVPACSAQDTWLVRMGKTMRTDGLISTDLDEYTFSLKTLVDNHEPGRVSYSAAVPHHTHAGRTLHIDVVYTMMENNMVKIRMVRVLWMPLFEKSKPATRRTVSGSVLASSSSSSSSSASSSSPAATSRASTHQLPRGQSVGTHAHERVSNENPHAALAALRAQMFSKSK
jgi:hypothetical protein